MKNSTIPPIISINRDGYRRKTILSRGTIYPLNMRIDKASHDNLTTIKAYYDRITGLRVRPSVIMRRALAVLADYLKSADDFSELSSILTASHMEDDNV